MSTVSRNYNFYFGFTGLYYFTGLFDIDKSI